MGEGRNIFETQCQAIVNPVNCEGVMGAGLALKFKQRYPSAFLEYQDACRKKLIVPGRCLVSFLGGTAGPRWAVQFPTKDRWRSPSRMEFIDAGLVDLVAMVRLHAIPSIAIPALGCGLGGLDWRTVKGKIETAFAPLQGQVVVELYDPQ
ncbi:MAG: macro domain-containing protein [Anaerolineae bacterium]|nr:macro domain-containing protein [Anaerolineae bacterium]